MKIKDAEIKAVIFDMDGVILDSMSVWRGLGPRFIRARGFDTDEYLEMNAKLDELMLSMSIEQGIAYFKEQYEIQETEAEIVKELLDLTRDAYYNEVEAKPGAKELMEYFSSNGISMAAATSSPRDHIEHALERNGLLQYIDRIWTSTEVGSSKHDPEIYDLAAAGMGSLPGETLVFEDTLYALKTAKAAGYHTAGVYDPCGEPDQEGLRAEAEVYVHDPADFLAQIFCV